MVAIKTTNNKTIRRAHLVFFQYETTGLWWWYDTNFYPNLSNEDEATCAYPTHGPFRILALAEKHAQMFNE